MNTIPQLPAIRLDNGSYKAWCDRCRRYHFHGGLGVKVAHCGLGPEHSYELVEASKEQAALQPSKEQ